MPLLFTRPGRRILRGGQRFGTIGAIVHAADGGAHMLTANHVVADLGNGSPVEVDGWSPANETLRDVTAIVTEKRDLEADLAVLTPSDGLVCADAPLGTKSCPRLLDSAQIQVGRGVLILAGTTSRWHQGTIAKLEESNRFCIQMHPLKPMTDPPDLDFDPDPAPTLYGGASGSPVYAWCSGSGAGFEIWLVGIVLKSSIDSRLVAVDPGPTLKKFGLVLEDS